MGRTNARPSGPSAATEPRGGTSAALLREVALLYYEQDQTQAEIADRLGVSRPSVSRLLSEARRRGIVRIEIPPLPEFSAQELQERLEEALGLQRIVIIDAVPTEIRGAMLAEALTELVGDVAMRRGSVLLLSTGRTIYDTITAHVPSLPGVTVVPAVGGMGDPEPWYEANALTGRFASSCGGNPEFLYAPALPGPDLHRTLLEDPSTARTLALWKQATVAVLGIGAPPRVRDSIAIDIPLTSPALRNAVGDVCLHFFDEDGQPVTFPGSERIVGTPVDVLRTIPTTIALATGNDKVTSIIGAARGGYMNQLITDVTTAEGILNHLSATSEQAGASS